MIAAIGSNAFLLQQLYKLLAIVVAMVLLRPYVAFAQVHQHTGKDGTIVVRSLESLRDLDYQSWQAVAYRQGPLGEPVTLRIVGYPGKMRLDHPIALRVISGRREWLLPDITLDNTSLAKDGRAAAAEFTLDPLLDGLNNNRPLRLYLPGVFNELPVPPYVVEEWREVRYRPLS